MASPEITTIITTLTDVIADLQAYDADRAAALTRLTNENTSLKIQLDACLHPPAPVKDRTPVLTRTDMRNIHQLTITLDAAPGAAKDAIGLSLIKLAKSSGFNSVRYLRNAQEIAGDVKLDPLNPRNLPAQTKAQGLLFIADSLDAMVPKLSASDLQVYVNNLWMAGAVALYLNDFDRSAIVSQQHEIVSRLRAVTTLPLIASVSANADLAHFDSLVDFTESQCFGTADEFKMFVKLPCDTLCLEGQRGVSTIYLTDIFNQYLASGRTNLAVYTGYDTGGTNWTKQPDTVLAYTYFMAKLAVA